ncbi:cysteine hydrolase family protein [Lactiplantibacillus mudanjiangensis]|uniref:Isochorismatase [Lactobacillus pentosus] n=1 Tax=Lactiplantibacillus mudanjiangensis TaxID=1296538 RepID=A0A660E5I3_9LACO|nr:isochorismatase family cysteine hydrolase [Lactiplantibacillus mudanjiangensis]VDG18956.1 isochorismatase [Lactobacillus pentosus] [Lactiplantibacillus mudanjiangensis]VDG25268.1 isochorismatase [Lactobacillus pentosus] [Lactiplantibacillus mudanjiangensis]VDG27479.1 isochorismatase [Lactobacillus pentosus] [Lactiplantibacillus mudanjiangensis]VDG33056.1 isochorismatase [Lactobacillus pentosus] [Lactiplantibacillus mudanjiangensis]
MATNDALLIIDYTNDFVATDGALTCGEPGQALAEKIVTLAETTLENDGWVLLPTDVHTPHDPYHPESKLFPPHNVRDTWGRELYGPVKPWFEQAKTNDHVWQFDKTRYSAFAGTDLDLRLRERHVDTLQLTGVCTDICVLHTAVDAYNLGYQLIIHRSAVASFNPTGHAWALEHFANTLGAQVV